MNTLYRLQISRRFTFDDARAALSYLEELGIDTLYCSPFYEAGSEHGYDITDPNRLNPDVGDFESFCRALKERHLALIIDVVPNHMGIARGKNRWWQDVLKRGPHSPFAHFFDIDWEVSGKVLLPILGESYDEALSLLRFENEQIWYYDTPLPLALHSHIPSEITPASLHALLEEQYYRLAHWKSAAHALNYRRFFNIAELVGVRIEDPQVLEAHHKWVFELVEKGVVDGLRIDHPDGLLRPKEYFERLRARKPLFTVVEKILVGDEELPDWDVEGSVGYEFLNHLNALFVQQQSKASFDALYSRFQKKSFEQIVYEAKEGFARAYMESEVEALARAFPLEESMFTREALAEALYHLIAAFPVYRTYLFEGEGKSVLEAAFTRTQPSLDPALLTYIKEVLLTKREITERFQQITAPIMAKGLEDTAFYRYNRLLSLNEVGGDPSRFGITVEAFHTFNKRKRERWPLGLLTTSTHDTKRSEDARMRLNILSEIPDEWAQMVERWRSLDQTIDADTAYMLYQTVLAVWPKEGVARRAFTPFFERVWEVVCKMIREAKVHTDWQTPNPTYEESVHVFLHRMLTPSSRFLALFLPFFQRIEPFAEKSTLSSLAIKVASPGLAETYQGNERWTYHLVDPDNRAPFAPGGEDEKSRFLKKLLRFRKEHRKLFVEGAYLPVDVPAPAIAFKRQTGDEELLVIAGRFFTLGDPVIALPLEKGYRDVLTEKEVIEDDLLQKEPAVYLYAKR